MSDNAPTLEAPIGSSPLLGKRAWLITDGKAGTIVQTRGVADALGLDVQEFSVFPEGLWRLLAPWVPVAPTENFGKPMTRFAPPWPDIAIASGRTSVPYIRALKRRAGDQTFTIIMQDPRTGQNTADLIWVPKHDKRRGANVITTLTSPHSITQAKLAKLRLALPEEIEKLPHPRIALILGGKNRVYTFTDDDDRRLAAALRSLAELGASFMITSSRRSHQGLVDVVENATRSAPRHVWDGNGDNPYHAYLAAADALVVTADSVNMCGEAAATGAPVFIFFPSGGSAKFTRFHKGLQAHGAARPLPLEFSALPDWHYEPLNSAPEIAREIEKRYLQARSTAGEG